MSSEKFAHSPEAEEKDFEDALLEADDLGKDNDQKNGERKNFGLKGDFKE